MGPDWRASVEMLAGLETLREVDGRRSASSQPSSVAGMRCKRKKPHVLHFRHRSARAKSFVSVSTRITRR